MKRKAWILVSLAGACLFLLVWFRKGVEPPNAGVQVQSPRQSADLGRPAPSRGGEQESAAFAPMPQGINAADLLKNAFVLFDSLSEEEKRILSHPKEEIDPAKAAAIYQRIQPILAQIRQAAHADYCDWCTGSLKFNQPNAQLEKTARLAKVGLWAAGYQFHTDPQEALEELSDNAKLGQSVGTVGLIGLMVECSIERHANELLLQNAGRITPELVARYPSLLGQSAIEVDLPGALEAEKEEFNDMMAKLSKSGEDALAQEVFQVNEPEFQRFEQEFGRMILASDSEFQHWVQQLKANKGILPAMLDNLDSLRERLRQTAIERSMLGAGIAIQLSGPGQLGAFYEPGSQSPFIYRPTADGFELQAQAKFRGEPILMRFNWNSPPL